MSTDNPHQALEFVPPSVDKLGELLPAYHFEKLIAKGGMGAVYKATQTSLDRPVAVKVLPPELGESESFRESFVKEAKLMARLNHPNLISVFDFGELEGMLYIVMEFVDGATLYEKTYGGHLEQKEALEVIIAICNGLANAHEAGILHRDIKPANIFITEAGVPKIGDFGLARPSGDTETGVIFGTPGYTAPEVLSAPEKVGPATDIFAVGIMLYEFLAGKIPGDIYEPVTKYAKCDPVIDRLIRKAIASNLAQRYSDASEFSDDLQEILRKLKNSSKTASSKLQTSSPQLAAPATPAAKPVAAGSAAKSKKSPVPQPAAASSGGGNARNIVIILVLLGAIYGALEWKKKREADIAKIEEQNKNLEKLEVNKAEKVPNSAQQKPQKPKKLSVDEIPTIKELSTLEQLAQLRSRLASGDRPASEMPKDTLHLNGGERFVLFIETPMTWHDAELWAQEHGAQLATFSSTTDAQKIAKLIPSGSSAWVGAATAGNKQWAWTDGTPWSDTLDIRKTSKLAFAQIDSDLFASAKKSSDTSGFLIEWKADGSTPDALAERMSRTAQTLDSPNPIYPPGSLNFGQRIYYLCPQPLTLDEAKEAAAAGGAHLATPSDDVELAYLADLVTSHLPSGKMARIGGQLNGSEWTWITGEEWKDASWDTNYPKENDSIAILATSQGPWRDVSSQEALPFTLFEWSADAPATKAGPTGPKTGATTSDFSKLQKKAAELIAKATEKRESQHQENVKRLKWDLEFHFKGLSKNEQVRQAYPIQEIKKLIDGEDRIKEKVAGMGNSAKVQKLTNDAYDKQGRIDSDFEEQIEKIRIVYNEKLRDIIKNLEAKKQLTAVKAAKMALKSSSAGTEKFIQLFN
ncbi:protein kinase domain-containing protein [Rubritalea tangerina]|uniref:Protein kinase n=1 Tax=Rubritalea tangerina TaxID=430798 RepID=A0ABW4ZEN8_9BACT